jgi:predicted nucleic acid-binding protein
VRLVIADTGPINYLLMIGHIGILPALFERVILPASVKDELADPDAPELVRKWIADPPRWLDIRQTSGPDAVADLGAGETGAITIAVELHADMLLMDERRGVRAARRLGIEVTGTLGILSRAGQRGIIDLAEAFNRLKQTSFRYRQEVMDQFLEEASRKP